MSAARRVRDGQLERPGPDDLRVVDDRDLVAVRAESRPVAGRGGRARDRSRSHCRGHRRAAGAAEAAAAAPPGSGPTPADPQAAATAARTMRMIRAAIDRPGRRPRSGAAHRAVLHVPTGTTRRRRPPGRGRAIAGSTPAARTDRLYTRAMHLPVRAAARADAGEGLRRAARRRWLAVRAEVGRLPGDRLPRRRRGPDPEPRPQAARSLLPGARGARSVPRSRSGASSTGRS